MAPRFDASRAAATQCDRHADALCRSLLRLPGYLEQCGMSQRAREVTRRLCAAFDGEIDLHRNRQEARLFPTLLAHSLGREMADVRDFVDALIAEHYALEQAWKRLRPSLVAIGSSRLTRLSIDEATQFATLYRNHVACENRHLFAPAASGGDRNRAPVPATEHAAEGLPA